MFARCPETYKPLEPGQTTTYNGNPLLPGWEDSVTHCVVMAGARASGKSLYLAVLIKQLELMALQRFTRVTIKAADESTRQRYKENYERPLYEEMKHMAPTPTSRIRAPPAGERFSSRTSTTSKELAGGGVSLSTGSSPHCASSAPEPRRRNAVRGSGSAPLG